MDHTVQELFECLLGFPLSVGTTPVYCKQVGAWHTRVFLQAIYALDSQLQGQGRSWHASGLGGPPAAQTADIMFGTCTRWLNFVK